MIRADNPHNCKKGGVSIYFKKHLAVHPVTPLNLNERLVLESNIHNKKGYVISLYRSPSQSKDEFDQFLLNFEQLTSDRMSQNPHFILVTGDFSVRLYFCWINDLTTSEGNQVDAVTLSYGLSQLICKPTHIWPNSSSCIDLILINQNDFLMDSGVHASLHPNCHHQLVHAKLNLKIEYPLAPPLYKRLVCDYNKTKKNNQLLNRTTETFNWNIRRTFHEFLFKKYSKNIPGILQDFENIFMKSKSPKICFVGYPVKILILTVSSLAMFF